MTSTLHHNIYLPEMKVNPPKTVCGCLCGGLIIFTKYLNKQKQKQTKNDHTLTHPMKGVDADMAG